MFISMKESGLHGDGLSSKPSLALPGCEKSSSSSLKITPVIGSITRDPKTRFIVDVVDTAIPKESTTDVCDLDR